MMAVAAPRGRLIAGLVAAIALLLGPMAAADGSAPNLAGTVVHAVVGDMGGPMMRRQGSTSNAGMFVRLDQATVPHGTVSFVVTNLGNRYHELVVLPPAGRYELVCNLPGHYAAGMYAEITVS
jgi:hypothetical protein